MYVFVFTWLCVLYVVKEVASFGGGGGVGAWSININGCGT